MLTGGNMPKKILIVDDEPNILKVLTSRFKSAGYEVVVASDGMQATMKAHREKPDLIIMDIKMPGGDGLAVYKNLQLSDDTGIIPIIFLTAHPSEEYKKQAMEMGADDFITKPFDEKQLMEKVKKALGET
jgi:two-component system, OmpR family, alkaline phosphatase synthesis response regulator PhoP